MSTSTTDAEVIALHPAGTGGADGPAAPVPDQPGDGLDELVLLQAVLKRIIERASAKYAEVQAAARRAYLARPTVRSTDALMDGRRAPVATLTRDRFKRPVVVTDEDALIEYVATYWPTEVEHVERVTRVTRTAIGNRLAPVEPEDPTDTRVVDTKTGEIVPWAIAHPAPSDSTSLTYNTAGRDAIDTALAAGQLAEVIGALMSITPAVDSAP